MKFRYKKFDSEAVRFFRPVIPIGVKYGGQSINYEVLVNSGADFCFLDAEIGVLLGIDVEKGKRDIVAGIAGQNAFYYIHKVEIEVGGHAYTTDVGFIPQVAGRYNNYGVVGQKGFFDQFIVKFDLLKEEVELKQR